jgi:hypothetical protein
VPVRELQRRWEQDRAPQPPVTSIIGGPQPRHLDVRPKNADPRAEGRFHARSQGARPVSELQIEVLKADTRENAAAGSAAGAYRSPISVIWNGRLRRT